MMRKAALLLLTTLVAMLLASGVALADTLRCKVVNNASSCPKGTDRADLMYGTELADTIEARGGNDTIQARKGGDTLKGEAGADALFGREGTDTLFGGSGSDNFETIMLDQSGNPLTNKRGEKITAGLRGGVGGDTLKGEAGNDDLMGNDGNDTLDDASPRNISDWDRAFGGPGNDNIDVADGDTRDEVICGEGDDDTAKIDVKRDASGNIEFADKVYEESPDGKSVRCREVKDQDGNVIDVGKDLPQSAAEKAPPEPVAEGE